MSRFSSPDISYNVASYFLLCCQSTDKSCGRIARISDMAEGHLSCAPAGLLPEVVDDVPLPRLTTTEVRMTNHGTDHVVAERAGQHAVDYEGAGAHLILYRIITEGQYEVVDCVGLHAFDLPDLCRKLPALHRADGMPRRESALLGSEAYNLLETVDQRLHDAGYAETLVHDVAYSDFVTALCLSACHLHAAAWEKAATVRRLAEG